MDRAEVVRMLGKVMSLPTAPFHEHRVRAFVVREAGRLGLPCHRDAFGNVCVEYRRGRGTVPVAFTGHMDHPGFEIVAGGQREALALWNGMVPSHDMVDVAVALHPAGGGPKRRGRILGPVERSTIDVPKPFPIATPVPLGPGAFGHLDLVPFRLGKGRKADLAFTKSADDLGGCAAVLLLLGELVARRATAHVLGIFTRAEEVGFYGALGIAKRREIPKDTFIVVMETSKELPLARIGHGPVVRVGDKARIFDADLLYVMKRVADDLAAGDGDFRYQLRVMDGGTCEATPYALQGYRAAGISFPLGNYHNVGKSRVAPEYISVRDATWGVELMLALARRAPEFEGMLREQREAIWAHLDSKLARLRATAGDPPAGP